MEQSLKRNFALFLFIILVCYVSGHKGCFEEERKGLLELKEVMGFMNRSSFIKDGFGFLLDDWVDDEGKNDCCEWSHVTCNHTTGHVTKIFLGGKYSSYKYIWSLNLSLFCPFKELRSLNLSDSNIDGWTKSEGLTYFSHLEILDFSGNYRIGGSIPSFIWELSTLKALYLAKNGLNGSLHIQGICELKKLEELDLSYNNLEGNLPPGICELKKLEELDLSYNNLEGNLPPCLNNLTSLRLLDLRDNQFTGNFSSSQIASPTSIEYIDLSYNQFEGLFSFSSFANHSKLQEVKIININTKFEVETESIDWIPKFQLKSLVLSYCNLNNLSREVPKFLFHQQRLRILDLSSNQLDGWFPSWLLENNTELEFLSLRNNSFSGPFHLPTVRNLNFKWMDISDNHFNGGIQANIGQMLPNVYYLDLSRNDFRGGFPSSIGDMSELMHLDLSVNNFSGEFPKQVAKGCTFLIVLVLSHNLFHGEFPITKFNVTEIWILKLDNNYFTGKLSNDFTGFNNLLMLDISDNFLSGPIPNWIGNVTDFLVLRNNSFEGQISHLPFTENMVFIDFSSNSLTGSLPPFTKSRDLKHLQLQGNKFTGSIPESYANLSGLLLLDLNDNNLSGNIPDFIGALSSLRILLLKDNCFSGLIPNQLCDLQLISLMDLSNNSLTGSIPKCLPNIFDSDHLAYDMEVYLSSLAVRGQAFQYERIVRNPYDGTNIIEPVVVGVDFVTKGMLWPYKSGSILDFMSGLDLSSNNLTGEIPIEMGMLVQILALNLSHNQLTGPIPKQFSQLVQIESLDLSFNSLSGKIPLELVDLTSLEVFIVAHNNLSGRLPERKAQFGTFSKESYEGNPFLCGPPIEKNCTPVTSSSPTASLDEDEEKWYEIDLVFFRASFVGTYLVFLLGAATVLYINPYWRRRWFTLVEEYMYSCYYFLCDFMRNVGL